MAANLVEIILRTTDQASPGITALAAKFDAIPAAAATASTESTRALDGIKTTVAQAEITRLTALVGELPAAAVEAAGGVEVAMRRIQTLEARAGITQLDAAIRALPVGAEMAAGETNIALNTIRPAVAEGAIASLGKEIDTLPAIAARSSVGVRAETDGIGAHFVTAKDHVAEWGQSIIDWGKRAAEALGLVGIAAGGIELGAVGQAAKFQGTVTQVQNNTTMTDADVTAMKRTVTQLAPTLGIDPNLLTQGYMHAFNLTGNGPLSEAILRQASESAKSTGDDPTRVTNILAQLVHEYGIDKMPNAAQMLPGIMGQAHLAAASANMTLPEFSQNFGQISAWAANLGVPMDQAMATYAMMTKHGFDPAEAATQVKDIFPHIIKPSSGALKEAGSLDARVAATGQDDGTSIASLLSADSLQKLGLSGIFEELHNKFTILGLDEAEQTAEIMKLIPNIRGGAATFTAIGQGAQDYSDILALLDDKTKTATVTHEAFLRTQQTVGFQWDRLKTSIEVAAIALGERFLPPLTRVMSAFSDQLPGALTAFGNVLSGKGNQTFMQQHPGATGENAEAMQAQSQLSPLAVIADAIGHAFVIARDAVKTFAEALSGNWTDSSKIEGIHRVIGTIGSILHDYVIPAVKDFAGWIGTVVQTFQQGGFAAGIGKLLVDMGGLGLQIGEQLVKWGAKLVAWVAPYIPPLLAELGKLTLRLFEWIGTQVPPLLVKLGEWGMQFAAWVAPRIGPMLDQLGTLIKRLGDWIIGQLPTLADNLIKWADQFIHWIVPMIPPFLIELVKIAVAITVWIAERVPEIALQLAKWAVEFTVWVAMTIPKLIIELGKLGVELIGWIGDQVPGIVAAVGKWLTAMVSWADDLWVKIAPKLGVFQTSVIVDYDQFGQRMGTHTEVALAPWLTSWDAFGRKLADAWNGPEGFTWTNIGHFFTEIDAGVTKWMNDSNLKWLTSWKELGKALQKAWDGPDGFTWTNIGHFFKETDTGITQWMNDNHLKWLTSWKELGKDLQKAWDGPEGFTWTNIGHFFEGIISGLESLWPRLTKALTQPFDDAGTGINGFFTGLKNLLNDFGKALGVGVIISGGIGLIQAITGNTPPGNGPAPALPTVRGGASGGSGGGPALGFTRFAGAPEDGIGRGGFPNAQAVLDAAKKATGIGALWDTASGALGKGADALWTEMLDKANLSLKLPGVLEPMGQAIITNLLAAAKDGALGLFGLVKDQVHPEGSPNFGGDEGGGTYSGGNGIIDAAQHVRGVWLFCEKFVGDVMQSLGLRYFRAASAEAHSYMQPLNPGFGPPGSIEFWRDGGDGHVAFNVDGAGTVFGTLKTASGTGFHNYANWAPAGWTLSPYANGGIINEPIIGRGASGRGYLFGEAGPERVTPLGAGGGLGDGSFDPSTFTLDPATITMFDLAKAKTKDLAANHSSVMDTMLAAARARNAQLLSGDSYTQQVMLAAAKAHNQSLSGNQSYTQQVMLAAAQAHNASLAGNQATTQAATLAAAKTHGTNVIANQAVTHGTLLANAQSSGQALVATHTQTLDQILLVVAQKLTELVNLIRTAFDGVVGTVHQAISTLPGAGGSPSGSTNYTQATMLAAAQAVNKRLASGYANGGWLTEPVMGVGPSGRMYSFAEDGPERIRNAQQEAALGGGGSTGQPLVVQLVVDGRVLAEVLHTNLLAKKRMTAQPLGLT